MQAFNNCKNYHDYLSVIGESLPMIQAKVYEDNADGLSFLTMINDAKDQNKIIKVFRLIDSQLSYKGTEENEMYKKINYILSTGVLFHDYRELIENLDASELFVLVYGNYSKVDDNNKELLPVFANKELLDAIIQKNEDDINNKIFNVFGISDYFFMIEEQFKGEPFDPNDDKKREKFINEIINKIKTNTLHNNVRNMLEYWNSDEVNEIKRGVFL